MNTTTTVLNHVPAPKPNAGKVRKPKQTKAEAVAPQNMLLAKALEASHKNAAFTALVTSAKQTLAEASDYFREGGEAEAKGRETANSVIKSLAEGLNAGLILPERVSQILGELFGFVPKSDGSDGKTPAGKGGDIRKRIVRLADTLAFVSGKDVKFFDPIPSDNVDQARLLCSSVLADVEGGKSTWRAYDEIADIKRDLLVKVPLAFDAKQIAKIVEALCGDEAVDRITSNEPLFNAYSALLKVLLVQFTPKQPTNA